MKAFVFAIVLALVLPVAPAHAWEPFGFPICKFISKSVDLAGEAVDKTIIEVGEIVVENTNVLITDEKSLLAETFKAMDVDAD